MDFQEKMKKRLERFSSQNEVKDGGSLNIKSLKRAHIDTQIPSDIDSSKKICAQTAGPVDQSTSINTINEELTEIQILKRISYPEMIDKNIDWVPLPKRNRRPRPT